MEDNSSAAHKVFFRAVESVKPYKFTQMTAFFVIAAYWMSFSLELYLRIYMAAKITQKQKTSSAAFRRKFILSTTF